MIAMRSERVAETTDMTAPQIEGEIRDLVRRDSSFWRRRAETAHGSEAVESVNSLIQRVSGATVDEIDRVMNELTTLRDLLRSEGDRINRELSGYATLSQSAMASMKVIAESLAALKPSSASPVIRSAPAAE